MSSRAITPSAETPDGFADRLKQAQAEAGLKNEDLARVVGVSVRLLQRWRSGDGEPSGPNLAALTRALGREASWFFADHDPDRQAA
jgi:transcriptional regulator with XRE-family HTH domain